MSKVEIRVLAPSDDDWWTFDRSDALDVERIKHLTDCVEALGWKSWVFIPGENRFYKYAQYRNLYAVRLGLEGSAA